MLDAAGAPDPVDVPKLNVGVVVAAGFEPNNPPAAGCVLALLPNRLVPVLFTSLGGGPAGVVEFPNIGFEAGVVDPTGGALDPPNRLDVAAGLFKPPNSPPPELAAGVLEAAGVPKLNVGVDEAAGAVGVVALDVPNNPPPEGAVPNENGVEPDEVAAGKPVLPKVPNGFFGASDMLGDVRSGNATSRGSFTLI